MNGKVAKRLRREAESVTVGEKPKITRRVYRSLKTEYKQSRIFTSK